MATTYKTGRWGQQEKQFLVDNAQTLTVEQLSKRLNRHPDSVKEKLNELGLHLKGEAAFQYNAEADLRNSKHWRELQQQLTPEELDFFLGQWREIVSQFRDDVHATEKMQIIDVIKVEILMNRCLKAQKQIEEDTRLYHRLLEDEKLKDEADRDKVAISQWQLMLTALASNNENLTKTYREFLREKKGLLEKMKATREQRIEKLESSKETAAGWIRKMLMDPDARKRVGERMEMMRLATNVEIVRLSEYHTYEDEGVDRPILNAESILLEDKDEEE